MGTPALHFPRFQKSPNEEQGRWKGIYVFHLKLEAHYLRWKHLPQEVRGKNSTSKIKRKYYYFQWFSFGLPPDKFSIWFFPPVPNGFNLQGNCRGHSVWFLTLYLNHFNQSHSCKHIKERCITAFVYMLVTKWAK